MFNCDENVILTDIDGVVLNWGTSFNTWMNEHGYKQQQDVPASYEVDVNYGIGRDESKKAIRLFNESAQIGFLPPLRDAVHYMKKLHEEYGFVFHAITSLSSDHNTQKLRIMNLENLFGKTLFEKFIILGCGDDKNDALEPYRNSGFIFVEDKVENATLGVSMGLDSILMEHDFNKSYHKRNGIPCVPNWKEIYLFATGQSWLD